MKLNFILKFLFGKYIGKFPYTLLTDKDCFSIKKPLIIKFYFSYFLIQQKAEWLDRVGGGNEETVATFHYIAAGQSAPEEWYCCKTELFKHIPTYSNLQIMLDAKFGIRKILFFAARSKRCVRVFDNSNFANFHTGHETKWSPQTRMLKRMLIDKNNMRHIF